PLQSGPAVVRAGNARLPIGNVVVLADESGAVPVLAQGLGDHRAALWDLTAIARIRIAEFGDDTRSNRMMVSSGQQCGACRRTQRCRVKARVAQAGLGEAVEVGGCDLTAKGTPLPKAAVIDQHDQNIGGAFRRPLYRDFVGRRILIRPPDDALELRL